VPYSKTPLLVLASLTTMACASAPRSPAPIASSEVATALERPREHPDAPLAVRDKRGRAYALSLDEPVKASTPPDGREMVTTVRELTKDCTLLDNQCWIRRPFDIEVLSEPAAPKSGSSSRRAADVLAGAVLVGSLAGMGYCAYECAEPWDKAVPIGGGVVLLTTLVVGAFYWANSVGAVR
jgi:hypothetical protein